MMLLQRLATSLSVILFALAITGQPVFATTETDVSQRISELASLMAKLQDEMTDIEREPDVRIRSAMLRNHMERMHQAISMMQESIVPKMGSWIDVLESVDKSSIGDNEDLNSDAHMEAMSQVMRQMVALMEQMSQHRRMLRDLQE